MSANVDVEAVNVHLAEGFKNASIRPRSNTFESVNRSNANSEYKWMVSWCNIEKNDYRFCTQF